MESDSTRAWAADVVRVFLILGLLCIAGVILLLVMWDRPRKQKTHRQSLPPSRWPEHPDL